MAPFFTLVRRRWPSLQVRFAADVTNHERRQSFSQKELLLKPVVQLDCTVFPRVSPVHVSLSFRLQQLNKPFPPEIPIESRRSGLRQPDFHSVMRTLDHKNENRITNEKILMRHTPLLTSTRCHNKASKRPLRLARTDRENQSRKRHASDFR